MRLHKGSLRMRIPVVYVAISFLSYAFLIVTDMLSGNSFYKAVQNLQSAFSVVTTGEYVVIISALCAPFLFSLAAWRRRKKKSKPI